MVFIGKQPIRSKIKLNEVLIEQVSNFHFLVPYKEHCKIRQTRKQKWSTKGCTLSEHITSEETRAEFNIFSMNDDRLVKQVVHYRLRRRGSRQNWKQA